MPHTVILTTTCKYVISTLNYTTCMCHIHVSGPFDFETKKNTISISDLAKSFSICPTFEQNPSSRFQVF